MKLKDFEIQPANILIYDDKNIKYYHGVLTQMNNSPIIDSGRFLSGEPYSRVMGYDINFYSADLEELNNIMLDETTMKRIAVYNKQQECKRLDKEIKEKQDAIDKLDDLLKDKEKRWNKVKEYIKNIYEINLHEDDDYEYEYVDD